MHGHSNIKFVLHLFNCVTENIKVTDGRKYFPPGPHFGQP